MIADLKQRVFYIAKLIQIPGEARYRGRYHTAGRSSSPRSRLGLFHVLEDLVAGKLEAGIAGSGDRAAADFVQDAVRIDRHFAKPRIDQPDIRYALAVVLFELLHHSGHAIVFRQDLDSQERG